MRNSVLLSAIIAVTAMPAAFAQESTPPGVPPSAIQQWQEGAQPVDSNTVAPGSLIDSQGGDAIPALPIQVRTAGTVSYLSGGIGDEELAELRSQKHQYNVHLLMNIPAGNYISNVAVDVRDSKGADVFNVSGVGPYLYFSLPPGRYTLTATSPGGDRHTARFAVPANGSANLHLVFKE